MKDNLKAEAQRLDSKDTLGSYRSEFYLPKGKIYLDGNSLGLLSKRAYASSLAVLESWKEYGIEGWTKGDTPWFYLPEKIAGLMAPLIGAKSHEVIITNSTTVNLHQLLATFYKPKGKRVKILADSLAFPSDMYAIKSHLALHGLNHKQALTIVKSRDGYLLSEEDIINAFTKEVAVAILPSVLYRSGQLLDIKKIVSAAHSMGILVGIDAAHSVGCIQHHFHADEVDFAFWCTYKYLNGGPGSVGGLFVHEKHLATAPGLAGWFSSDKTKQFEMSHALSPASDAGKYQIGTPHVTSLSALLGSLEIFTEVGLGALKKKSELLTEYLIQLIDDQLTEHGFSVITPRNKKLRGGHIAVTHQDAVLIGHSMRNMGVVPDFRPPNVLRLAPIALYTSFMDVYKAVQIIKTIVETKSYKQDTSKREIVS